MTTSVLMGHTFGIAAFFLPGFLALMLGPATGRLLRALHDRRSR